MPLCHEHAIWVFAGLRPFNAHQRFLGPDASSGYMCTSLAGLHRQHENRQFCKITASHIFLRLGRWHLRGQAAGVFSRSEKNGALGGSSASAAIIEGH